MVDMKESLALITDIEEVKALIKASHQSNCLSKEHEKIEELAKVLKNCKNRTKELDGHHLFQLNEICLTSILHYDLSSV